MDEQVQEESFPSVSQSHTQPPLHSTVNLKFLGLGILLVLIVATGAFLVGERWQRSQPVTPILAPSIKVTPPNDKYLTDAVYCEKDEDCISQKVSCNNCGCPIPKNVYNDQSPQCDLSKIKNGPHCDIYCSPTVPKCSNSKCTLVDSANQQIQSPTVSNTSNWQSYSATDPQFGVKTTMSLPEGYSFVFESGFWIDNDADHTEQWHYYTSVNNGKNGLQNYYDGASLLDWYERRLNGEFVTEGEYPKKSGEILSSSNHPIGKQSYLEIKVKEYTGNVEMHYVYLQNGIVHIILPATKPINPNSLISKNIGLIFTSLSSSVFKVRL